MGLRTRSWTPIGCPDWRFACTPRRMSDRPRSTAGTAWGNRCRAERNVVCPRHRPERALPLDGWIAVCERTSLRRSMSRKGMSCDNARAEGFFGPIKQELFYSADWTGVSREDFMRELDRWMRWLREGRISQAPGCRTSEEHRLALGYAV